MIFPSARIMRALLPVALATAAFLGRDLAQEANPSPAEVQNRVTNGHEESGLSMPEGNIEAPSAPELLPQSTAIPIRSPLVPGASSPGQMPGGRQIPVTRKPLSPEQQRRSKNPRRFSRARHTRFSHFALGRRARLHSGTRVNLQHRSLRREHRAHRTRRRVVVYEYVDWGPR
jgi:hypothetical protein